MYWRLIFIINKSNSEICSYFIFGICNITTITYLCFYLSSLKNIKGIATRLVTSATYMLQLFYLLIITLIWYKTQKVSYHLSSHSNLTYLPFFRDIICVATRLVTSGISKAGYYTFFGEMERWFKSNIFEFITPILLISQIHTYNQVAKLWVTSLSVKSSILLFTAFRGISSVGRA